jgi:tetratricopeptide (TPR) repeat protein
VADQRRASGSSSRGGRPTGKGAPRRSSSSSAGGQRGERRDAPRRDSRSAAPRRERDAARTREQEIYDGPPLPDDITGKELAADVRAQLRSLPEKLALRVSRHLAAAGQLIDDEPETAYQHTLAARARAPRLAVVREAAGEAAYAAGHYAEALAELRAAKRMNGATAYLPIMADCHRALGNAKRAIELAKSPSVARFAAPAKAEMTIVEAGARRDLGQLDAALRILELSPLNSKSRESWVVRLRYAYADTLEQAGREQDALSWFHRTNAIDSDEITDAAERAAALESRLS